MSTQLPLVIRTLSEKLRFRYRGPLSVGRLDTFLVDLSDWKLSLTDQTPCVWLHKPEHLSLSSLDLAEEIRDAVRQKTWQNTPILVLADGPAENLRRHLGGPYTQFVVLGAEQQKAISQAPSPTGAMLDALMAQMRRSQLAPYETGRPVRGNRFFGRATYLNKILHHPKANFLILGIRRIGKTSLLREIERILNQSDPPQADQQRRLYVDCSVIQTPDEFYSEIVSRLSPLDMKRILGRGRKSLRFQAQMFEYLKSRHGGQVTFLLDEVDRLLENLRRDYSLFDVLRKASAQDDAARFIMAGFRGPRRAFNDWDTPMHNFGEMVTLGPLERGDVKNMVQAPLDRLRVKLDPREEITMRIYRETAGLPHLVQFYCQTLLEQLDHGDGQASVIRQEDLHAVYENAAFRDVVLETFMANSLPLERAIVFALAGLSDGGGQASFSQKEIDVQLDCRNLSIRFRDLDEACRNLVTAGILRQQGRQYSFSIPLFARMLHENYSLDFAFDKAKQEVLDGEFAR